MRRRTRQAALSLSRIRLIMLRNALYKLNVHQIEKRIQIAQPSDVIPKPGQLGVIPLTPTGL